MQRSLSQVLATENKNSQKWPGRGAPNRLEPECWPILSPGFQFERGCAVFTIGSCFARNIEAHLARAGFDVPAATFIDDHRAELGIIGPELLNKYTPPSIYQEMAWTKAILDRDDHVSTDDIAPFLLELENGNVIDLMRRNNPRGGADREAVLTQRQSFYKLFRRAFTCNVVVITLGYVECWFDKKFDHYIEFSPRLAEHNSDDRFCFKRLDYPECYKYTRDVIDLLNADSAKRILLTTSPVPLSRTFTEDDVIIANNYSKSVLRAVAGKIAEDYETVDYFPAYESVMLTKQPYVWEDDLIHIESAFVARVMSRVSESYLPSSPSGDISLANDEFLRFADLVKHRRFEDAAKIYRNLEGRGFDDAPAEFLIAAAEFMLHGGDHSKAGELVDTATGAARKLGKVGYALLFRCAAVYAELGNRSDEVSCFVHVFESSQDFSRVVGRYIRFASRSDTTFDSLLKFAIGKLNKDSAFLRIVARIYEQKQRFEDAAQIHDLIALNDDADALLQRARNLFKDERFNEAVGLHVRALELDPSLATRLAAWPRRYLRAGRQGEAASLATRLQKLQPDNANVASILAQSLGTTSAPER